MLTLRKMEERRDERQQLVSRSGEPLLWAFTAKTALQRLKGLFAYPRLSKAQALILSPCSSVHSIGLGYAIDVVFLCAEGRILKVGTLKPWSIMICTQGKHVLEMEEGSVRLLNLQVGELLDIWSDIVDVFNAADMSGTVNECQTDMRESLGGLQ